jgi:hypothetical protein
VTIICILNGCPVIKRLNEPFDNRNHPDIICSLYSVNYQAMAIKGDLLKRAVSCTKGNGLIVFKLQCFCMVSYPKLRGLVGWVQNR